MLENFNLLTYTVSVDKESIQVTKRPYGVTFHNRGLFTKVNVLTSWMWNTISLVRFSHSRKKQRRETELLKK